MKPIITQTGEAEYTVSARVQLTDGTYRNVQIVVPSDGSLWDEEILDAALWMARETYPGCAGQVDSVVRVAVGRDALNDAGVVNGNAHLMSPAVGQQRAWSKKGCHS